MSTPDHRTAPGSSYFVTTRCAQDRNVFQIPEVAQNLITAILHYWDAKAYFLHEFVVMPNPLHSLTPGPSTSLEKWQIKTEYIRMNPVRAQLADNPEDWFFSSATAKFALDPPPGKYLQLASAAKAASASTGTSGLKPRPPKEDRAGGPPTS